MWGRKVSVLETRDKSETNVLEMSLMYYQEQGHFIFRGTFQRTICGVGYCSSRPRLFYPVEEFTSYVTSIADVTTQKQISQTLLGPLSQDSKYMF